MAGQGERLLAVESAVKDINAKFDSLLAAVAGPHHTHYRAPVSGPTPHFTQAPPTPLQGMQQAPHGGAHSTRNQASTLPPMPPGFPPPQGLKGPGYDDYVLDQLRREEFLAPRHEDGKGFTNDIFNKVLAPKPYMYLTRQGVNTIKKKLEVRESMSFKEYILAYIKMVRDPRAAQTQSVYYHLEHLQHLAEDALLRDWPAARSWSQNTLDEIEKGTYSWQDTYTIQMERLSHAINAARPTPQHHGERAEREVACREFNGDRGCSHGGPNRHHSSGNIKHIHVCSYCMGQGAGRHPHSRLSCIRRDTDNGIPPPPPRRVYPKNGQ